MKRRDLTFLLITILLFFFVMNKSALAGERNFLIKYILPDKAGKLLFIGGKKEDQKEKIEYKITRLTDPCRMVVDIENADLLDEDGKKSVKIENEKITEEIRIAQFSTEPDVVRLVFTADSDETLDEIKIKKFKNSLVFEFDTVELVKVPTPSVYRDRNEEKQTVKESSLEKEEDKKTSEEKGDSETEETTNTEEKAVSEGKEEDEAKDKKAILNEIKEKVDHNIIINNVEQHENRILISGAGIISIAEPFALDSPGRVIFDIPDAVLNSPEQIRTFALKNNDIARIAQFDPKTVRIVIESNNPDQYINVVSPDLQSIIISPESELSFKEFPDNSVKGKIQDVKIVKRSDTKTSLILMSEKPIIHSIKRLYSPDRAHLNLYNIKKPSDEILEKLETTGQFHGIEIEPQDKFPNGSKWVLPLNRSTIIELKLSLDGRILEISLNDEMTVPLNASDTVKGKIILDPGHGGYDPGANRNGFYEKDIALDIARRVKKYLDKQGFYVLMTRETDKTISLKDRVAFTNKEKPDVFMSIHVNASRNPNIKGIETHWHTLQSRPLAMHVQDQLANRMVIPDRGIKNSRFYVIRNSKVPAALAEIGYISNEVEMYQLMTEERRESTAKAIAEGIISYIKSKNSNSAPTGKDKL